MLILVKPNKSVKGFDCGICTKAQPLNRFSFGAMCKMVSNSQSQIPPNGGNDLTNSNMYKMTIRISKGPTRFLVYLCPLLR